MLNPVAAVLSRNTLKTPHCSDVGAGELVLATVIAVCTETGVAAAGVAAHAPTASPNNQIPNTPRRITVADVDESPAIGHDETVMAGQGLVEQLGDERDDRDDRSGDPKNAQTRHQRLNGPGCRLVRHLCDYARLSPGRWRGLRLELVERGSGGFDDRARHIVREGVPDDVPFAVRDDRAVFAQHSEMLARD